MAESIAPLKVEISHKTVVFTVAFIIGVWFLYLIKEIIIVIFLSIILLSALLKPVEWLTKRKIPRFLSVTIVYILTIVIISTVIGLLIPPVVKQTQEFVSKLPQIITTINSFLIFNEIPVEDLSKIIARQIEQIAGDIVKVSTTIFSRVLLVLTMFVLAFYLLLEWDKFIRLIASPFSGKQEKKIINTITKIEYGLGMWLRGQIALSVIVGISVYVGLILLGIPFALPLAVIAGLLEIIPVIGPTVSSIPAILVGLTINPLLGLAVAALYIVIQQIESNVFAPLIMSKAAGLYPPVIIISLLIGLTVAGVAGAILAVPLVITVRAIVNELLMDDQKLMHTQDLKVKDF